MIIIIAEPSMTIIMTIILSVVRFRLEAAFDSHDCLSITDLGRTDKKPGYEPHKDGGDDCGY